MSVVVDRLVEAISRKDIDAYGSLYASEAVMYEPLLPEPARGKREIMESEAALFRAFSEIEISVNNEFGSGRVMMAEVVLSATNDGPLDVGAGEVPATGRRIEIPMVWAFDLNEEELVVGGGRGDDISDESNYIWGSLMGGPGNDVVRGGPGDDEVEGGQGRSVDGADFLYGGNGDDLLADNATAWCGGYGCHWSDSANDHLFGGPGTDLLGTTGGDDYQYGGYGADFLGETWGDHSQNYEDFRTQDSGDDTYDGGPASDRVSFRWSSTSVFVDLAAGRATGESSGEDVLLNLESVEGSRQG
jgi:hypothetical protein